MNFYRFVIFISFIFCVAGASADDDPATWNINLDSIVVKAYRYNSPVKVAKSGATVWSMKDLQLMPQILSNADPISYAQMLPGIQTNNEYHGGLNIAGCDNQHNLISIQGIPIYNATHLLGLFSIFNSSHFGAMELSKSAIGANSPNRLGGIMNMTHSEQPADSVAHATVTVGMMSSQATLSLPVNRKTELKLSARVSYLNLLYHDFFTLDNKSLNYSFGDINASLRHKINEQNSLLADFYIGKDKASYEDDSYLANVDASWGNILGAVHWLHNSENLSLESAVYCTSFRNNLEIKLTDISYLTPSQITDLGIKSNASWRNLTFGVEAIYHSVMPQRIECIGSYNDFTSPNEYQDAFEGNLYGAYTYHINNLVAVTPGIRGSFFRNGSSLYGAADPSLSIELKKDDWQLSAAYAMKHQYMFQTGFSDFGFPTEFWIGANERLKPQYGHTVSLSGDIFLLNRRYRLSAEVFYKRLFNQTAYNGSILDYTDSNFNIYKSLIYGNGYNYGFGITINKCYGKLSGWIGYAFTKARREFNERNLSGSYPASHERPHELNLVAAYTLNKHWSFGSTFVYASGTPFTAAEAIYVLNNNFVLKYGDYNGVRLRPYIRLNLSANYRWQAGKNREHLINFSVYNATATRNDLFYFLRIDKNGEFRYKPVSFFARILPSLSYTYKF